MNLGRRKESLAILHDLETQGLYKALHEDLAEVLDVGVGAFDVRSGTDFDSSLKIDHPP